MKFKDSLKLSMEMLSKDKKTRFLGYNICNGSYAYGTLKDIPIKQKIEMPVAENLMVGMATGMALDGLKPIVFFERHDFMLNALDAIKHIDTLEEMTSGEFCAPVIIRATVGNKTPLHPGPQHIADFTDAFYNMLKFPIYEPGKPEEVLEIYEQLKSFKYPAMVIERKDFYNRK